MMSRAVLLLHSIGLDADAYGVLRQALGAEWAFNSFDQRGHGRVAARTAFTLSDLVNDALAALDCIAGPVHLVGHSMGGAVAALAAARAGTKVASLALIASPPAAVPAFAERALAAETDLAASRETTLARWFDGETADTTEATATANRAFAPVRPEGLASAWRALAAFEGHAAIREALPRTLCIAGENDASTPPQAMERIVTSRRAIHPAADIHLAIVPGAGHLVPLTHPGPVAAMLAAHWVASQR